MDGSTLSELPLARKSPITLWASEKQRQQQPKWVSVCMLYQVPNSLFPNLIDQLNRERSSELLLMPMAAALLYVVTF